LRSHALFFFVLAKRDGFWPCPLLANMRLMWVRLWRLAPGRSRGGMRWILSKKRWSHHRYVRARRPTLRGRTNSQTCSMVRFAVDGLFVPRLNDRSTTAPRTLHRYLTGHGSVKPCRYRMLESPGDADRATTYVADVLARSEEVVRCR
jgi:hypothetical protein